MRYSIHQIDDTTWELRAEDGTVVATFNDAPGHTGYDQACSHLGTLLSEQLEAVTAISPEARAALAENYSDSEAAQNALLPERWTSDQGVAFSRDTDGGRDFSNCAWSWRDPTTSLLPLMFQTENEGGHWGAELAGYIEEVTLAGGTVAMNGCFFNSEVGIQARDTLLGAGRFGVSVDPSEAVEVEYHEECIQTDEDGWCVEMDFSVLFTAYEIAGLTMTPFPCFEEASIILDPSTSSSGDSTASIVRASAPARPPREWFLLAEPRLGHDFLGDLIGNDVLVPQRDRRTGEATTMACPLTIRDDGLIYGHLTTRGQCHVGDPWGAGVCASAPLSANGYADFLTGATQCADGGTIATGVLTVGCEHSSAMDVQGVRDHMAHAGMGWADVRVVDGEYGPWLCGALRPDVTDSQLRVLRSLSLSGEWVGELAAILAVNVPGLPVQRALAASAFKGHTIATGVVRASIKGAVAHVLGSTLVQPCRECSKRQRVPAGATMVGRSIETKLDRILERLDTLDTRTKHLIPVQREATRTRLAAAVGAE